MTSAVADGVGGDGDRAARLRSARPRRHSEGLRPRCVPGRIRPRPIAAPTSALAHAVPRRRSDVHRSDCRCLRRRVGGLRAADGDDDGARLAATDRRAPRACRPRERRRRFRPRCGRRGVGRPLVARRLGARSILAATAIPVAVASTRARAAAPALTAGLAPVVARDPALPRRADGGRRHAALFVALVDLHEAQVRRVLVLVAGVFAGDGRQPARILLAIVGAGPGDLRRPAGARKAESD